MLYEVITNVISSVAQIDAIWKRDFPDEADWRDTSDQFGLPGYLAEIAARLNQARRITSYNVCYTKLLRRFVHFRL